MAEQQEVQVLLDAAREQLEFAMKAVEAAGETLVAALIAEAQHALDQRIGDGPLPSSD